MKDKPGERDFLGQEMKTMVKKNRPLARKLSENSEATLKKIIALIFILTIAVLGGRQVIITKTPSGGHPSLPKADFEIKLLRPGGVETMVAGKFRDLGYFRDFGLPGKLEKNRATWNVLVLKVEFAEDSDSFSTGSGKMDLLGFGFPEDGLFYDPPHVKKYFENQMRYLSNFYKANSFGNCVVNYEVKPDRPLDNYQLPHKMSFYSGFDHIENIGGQQLIYFNTYAMEMGMVRIISDGIAAADLDETIDFSDYDAIIVFHAGTLLQTSINFYRLYDIPSATIPPGALEFYLGVPYLLANGGTDTIQCPISLNSEMARVDEYMVGALGTVVHEFGHVLGLPDLYDIYSVSNGVGAWDLMCTGGWTGNYQVGAPEGSIPANLGAWSRYFFGHYTSDPVWVEPVTITGPESLLTLLAQEVDTLEQALAGQTMIKIPVSPSEFFLIENRQQDIKHKDTIIVDVEDGVPVYVYEGEYDFFLPGSGILVWHIDDNVVYANYTYNEIQVNPLHKGIDLEEADGIQHFDLWYYIDSLEYYGSKYDAFFKDDSSKANHEFGTFTNPNSDSYFGKTLLSIDVQSDRDTLMDFSVAFDIYQEGFPVALPLRRSIFSLSYGDLDGNGDREVVAATRRGNIYVYDHDGSLHSSAIVDTVSTFLAVGDINGDNAEDLVFGSGFDIMAMDGTTLVPLPGFPFHADDIILGAPLLFDIDGDNGLEVIFGSQDRNLYCLNGDGTSQDNFPIPLGSWIFSTPCVFDEENREIGVLGSEGIFRLVNENGVIKEFTNSQHNMLTYASPVVGDMDRDNEPEAVIINGYGTVYIYGRDTLEQKFEIWIDTTFYFTPALADVDKDGYLEVIAPSSSKTIFVCNRNGTAENNFPLYTQENILHPLLIADLDTVGKEEIIFGLAAADSMSQGRLKLVTDRNRQSAFSPLFGDGGFTSPGFVFDLDLDGDLELACGSDSGKIYIWDFPGNECSWSGYMNSTKNWGRYEGELVPVSQTGSYLVGSFYMYPSPVARNGTVRFFLTRRATVKVDILDISGHVVGGTRMDQTTANEYNEIGFDFSRQTNGVYLVRIEASDGNKREVKFKKFAVLK